MRSPLRRPLLLALLLALVLGSPAVAQRAESEYEGSAALGLALRRLGTAKRVLMIGAHPDDESTQILSTLALGQGAEVAYLSLTRGEGGQNGIGPELGESLGLVRSGELLAARRLDGARQYFTRAYDFGFSKNADEAFRHWPRDTLLTDVVAVVRDFQPDLILSVFSGTPRDGHGHHQAAGILAAEAFRAAGPPDRYPALTARGLAPHAPGKLYQALWFRDDGEGERLFTGTVDPLLGRSHYQVAMASRGRHRSQDMGRELVAGPQSSLLRLVESRGGPADSVSLWAGVDTTVGSGPLAERYLRGVRAAREAFNPLRPDALVPQLAAAALTLDSLAPLGMAGIDLRAEREEMAEALLHAARVQVDALAGAETVVPGEAVEVSLSVWNGGERPIELRAMSLAHPAGWRVEPLDSLPRAVAPNTLARRRFRVTVPPDAPVTEPYFLRAPRRGDLYRWPDTLAVGRPFEPGPLQAQVELVVGGAVVGREREVAFRAVDKVLGESRRPLRVVPSVALSISPAAAALPLGAGAGAARRFTVRLQADEPGGIAGTLRLTAPAGWSLSPSELPMRFESAGLLRSVEVTATPPAGLAAGLVELRAAFHAQDGRRFTRGYSLVDYPHIEPRPTFREAAAEILALDVRLPAGLRVGYVAGPGDDVPGALEQLGVRVELLDPAALASADLSGYDAVVTGIRAYEVRPDLVAHNQRLLDYARAGGTVVVQYNKYEYTEPGISPYPVQMSRPHDRVTDESAAVRILHPEHPALAWPNRITERDFQGWQQERGLYFLDRWDERFTPLLEMADPGEEPQRGALLVADVGRGRYVYTGLALFRQLPAGVPGAYRLFANLLSLGKAP